MHSTIVINGVSYTVNTHNLTYEEIIKLAKAHPEATITYYKRLSPDSHRSGTLSKGNIVFNVNGLIFTAVFTGNS